MTLEQICKKINFEPEICYEVGVGELKTSKILPFLINGASCVFIEANPRLFYCICNPHNFEYFYSSWPNIDNIKIDTLGISRMKNFHAFNVAVSDYCGVTEISENKNSSFISNKRIEDLAEDKAYHKYMVPCNTFDVLDCKNIDLISIDIEGGEYDVLRYMNSRPKIISIETHYVYSKYVNPKIKEINQWMLDNGYKKFFTGESDTVFIK